MFKLAAAPAAILVSRNGGTEWGGMEMKRLAAVFLGVFGLALLGAGGVAAADGSYGPWQPTYQGPITAPAGVVCPFEVTAEPVREDLRVRYHYDADGNVDGYEASGQLIGRITNDETGASVVRNLSGPGTVTFNPDGSYDAEVSGDFLVFFLAQDSPSNELLLLSGHTVLHGAPSGEKTLVSSSGQTENLCNTLG
jgi:hypothetical protein